MPFLKKDMVPDVTSGDTAFANVDFLLVSGHGNADLKRYMIVPENTFVFFLGASGFIRDMKQQLEKFRKLIGYTAYIPVGTQIRHSDPASMKVMVDAQEAYRAAFYSTFFGKSDDLKFYPNASIYVPGDILPDTHVSFQSGPQDIWHKGVYSLPVPPKQEREFLLEQTLMDRFVTDIGNKKIPITALRDAKVKDSKLAQVLTMLTMSREARNAAHGELDVMEFFDEPEVITAYYDQEFYTFAPNNLAPKAGVSMDGLYLSEIVAKIPSARPYRFFIFTACRGPISEKGRSFYANNSAFRMNLHPVAIPNSIPKAKERQLLRRLSITARCSTREEAPLNLKRVREAAKACFKELEERARAGAKLPDEVKPLMRTTRRFFNWGPPHQYRMFVRAETLAQYLNEILAPTVEGFPKTRAFQLELRQAFGPLIQSLRSDLSLIGLKHEGHTIGEVLLRRTGLRVPKKATFREEGEKWLSLQGETTLGENLAERRGTRFKEVMDALIESYKGEVKTLMESAKEVIGKLKTIAEAERAQEEFNRARRELDEDLDEAHGDVLGGFSVVSKEMEEYRQADIMDMMEQLEEGGTIHRLFQQFIRGAAKEERERLAAVAAAAPTNGL